jgi:hypothetical protein
MSTKRDKFFQMRVDDGLLGRLDNLRRARADLPSRTEMVRRLIEEASEESEVRGTEDRLQIGRERKSRADSSLRSQRSKQRAHAG